MRNPLESNENNREMKLSHLSTFKLLAYRFYQNDAGYYFATSELTLKQIYHQTFHFVILLTLETLWFELKNERFRLVV